MVEWLLNQHFHAKFSCLRLCVVREGAICYIVWTHRLECGSYHVSSYVVDATDQIETVGIIQVITSYYEVYHVFAS